MLDSLFFTKKNRPLLYYWRGWIVTSISPLSQLYSNKNIRFGSLTAYDQRD